jgi:superfamily II DNA or RNA helicase
VCGTILEDGWHSDHIIPSSKGGETSMSNLRATCPKCNLKKGNKMFVSNELDQMIKKADNYIAKSIKYFTRHFPNNKNMRTCQIEAYDVILSKLISGKMSASAFLPTGCGKSDLIRAIAWGLCKTMRCFAGVWAFSPSTALQSQLCRDCLDETFDRLGIENLSYSPYMTIDRLDGARFRNNTILESFTTQFLITNDNIADFLRQAAKIKRETGLFPIAIFDESHLFSTDNTWGKSAIEMHKFGIPICLVTGTPLRTDKLQIPGFEVELYETIDKKFTKTETTNDPAYIKLIRGNMRVCKYKLKADYEYTYRQAWDDGVILKPKPDFVDATSDFYNQLFSEMTRSQSDRLLRTFLFDDRTIRSTVERTINSLRARKKVDITSAAIVATLSDEPEEDELNNVDESADLHARKIAREFHKLAPDLKVLIITSKSNTEGGLDAFRKGDYDVLIVKVMGTVGFNCRRIKTITNLSNHRTLAAIIQFINRGCRHFANMGSYDVIMPRDKSMVDLWNKFMDFSGLTAEETKELDRTEDIKEKESNNAEEDKPKHQFDKHTWSSDPITGRNQIDEILEKMQKKLPVFYSRAKNTQEMLSHWDIVSKIAGVDWLDKIPEDVMETATLLIDCNEEESRLRSTALDLHKELTIEIMKISGSPFGEYGNIAKSVWTCIKKKCGFRPNQSINNICGIENFKQIISSGEWIKHQLMKVSDTEFNYNKYLSKLI